jgi:hypothetical protein
MSGNKSERRNWGSHLFVAIIGVVAGAVGTIVFIAGKDSPRSTPEEKQEISTSIPSPTTKPSIRAPNKKGSSGIAVKAPNILCHQYAKTS